MIKFTKTKISCCIVLFMMLMTTLPLKAQHLEIIPFAGYQTGGQIYTNLGYLRVAGGLNFGGSISYGGDEELQMEFTYNHLTSELSLDNGEYTTKKTALNVNYYNLGVIRSFLLGEKERFIPFAGGGFGMVNYITPDDGYSNELLGDVHLSGGFKVRFNDFMGIRLQARLLLPLYWSGAYFYGGTAEDGYGVSSTCVMVQGDFTGSIYFIID